MVTSKQMILTLQVSEKVAIELAVTGAMSIDWRDGTERKKWTYFCQIVRTSDTIMLEQFPVT